MNLTIHHWAGKKNTDALSRNPALSAVSAVKADQVEGSGKAVSGQCIGVEGEVTSGQRVDVEWMVRQ